MGVRRRGWHHQSKQHHQHRMSSQLGSIMTVGLVPDAMKPGIQRVRTQWIRGFMAFAAGSAPVIAMAVMPV
jgi:hypothetical protein